MTNITRRTALRGATAALAGAGLAVAGNTLTPTTDLASEPAPLADVTTRLGDAMDEVSALLSEWSNGTFRAIIGPDRDYWLQNRMLHVPQRTEHLIVAWCDTNDRCNALWKRVSRAKPGTLAREQRHAIWLVAYNERDDSLSAMLRALHDDRRTKALPKVRRAAA